MFPVVGSSPTPTLFRSPIPRIVPVLEKCTGLPINSSMFQYLIILRPVLGSVVSMSTLSWDPRDTMSLLGSHHGTTRVRVWWKPPCCIPVMRCFGWPTVPATGS